MFSVDVLFGYDRGLKVLDDFVVEQHDLYPELNSYVFGCLYRSRICGGRYDAYELFPYDVNLSIKDRQLYRDIETLNERGVGFYLTATNYFVTKDDLADIRFNDLLSVMNAGKGNGVVVAVPHMIPYIRKHYPNLCITNSVTAYHMFSSHTKAISYYNQMCDICDYVVVHNSTVNINNLGQLSSPEQIEYIVYNKCYFTCPNGRAHYELMSRVNYQEFVKIPDDIMDRLQGCCQSINRSSVEAGIEPGLTVMKDYFSILCDCGIRRFKIAARLTADAEELVPATFNRLVVPELARRRRNQSALEEGVVSNYSFKAVSAV